MQGSGKGAANVPQEYLVPSGHGEAEFVEKKSRFIGRVWLTETEAEALACIASMREQHWDAAHNVYAYSIRNGQTRYSDDGEPQGTSGMPTLNVFRSEGVFNVCCVVTRYFGGTLLGAGGLVRAYSKAAKMALDAAGVSVMRQWDVLLIACEYSFFERAKALIATHGGVVESSDFAADIVIEALIPAAATDAFCAKLTDMSAGTIVPERLDPVFRAARLR